MLNAKEAREMMERAIENEILKLKENATQFCEELSKEIQACASKKYGNVIVTVHNSVKRNYVIEILKENGYSVKDRSDGKHDTKW